jgi:WD40 repeat protein
MSNNPLKVWDVQEGHLFYTLRGHTGSVNCVAFAPLGDFFCSSGDDTNLMVNTSFVDMFSCAFLDHSALQVWKTNFDTKQGNQRPRSAPSPSRVAAESSLNSRSSGRGGAPTRVSNSPGIRLDR